MKYLKLYEDVDNWIEDFEEEDIYFNTLDDFMNNEDIFIWDKKFIKIYKEDYDEVMTRLEDFGVLWGNGKSPPDISWDEITSYAVYQGQGHTDYIYVNITKTMKDDIPVSMQIMNTKETENQNVEIVNL